jgi:NHLM bacteriocin system ABC transporter ATP-binding protein
MHHHPDDKIVAHAVAQLAAIFSAEDSVPLITENDQDALWRACSYVGRAMHITMVKPPIAAFSGTAHTALLAIAQASQCRMRTVALKGRWWEEDNGPLLAFDPQNMQPIALTLTFGGQYQWLDAAGILQPLTPAYSETLAPQGYMFYRTLPAKSLNLFALLKFALIQQKHDLFRITLLQMGIGLLALLTPIATGIILDTVVPEANVGLLQQWLIGLGVNLLGASAFGVVQSLLLLRFRFKTDAATQAAIWDRLLRLPVHFFQQFSAGDLTMRASGIDTIQQTLTSVTLQTVLSSFFSLFTLALMFYYSPSLALIAISILIPILLLMWLSAYLQLQYQRPIAYLQGQLASLTLQFLTGISKLRVRHSEKPVFALWVEQFAHKNRLSMSAGILDIRFTILYGLVTTLGTVGLYAMAGTHTESISFGSFIAFNAAFGQFFAATLALGGIVSSLVELIPLYERIQPILNEVPEREREGEDPGILSGEIHVKGVHFRYQPDSPWVLEDISLSIRAGEMVALVGSTGCGKSTLFRLMLGFEEPKIGHILYGDHALETLNLRALREQFGVVLQNSTILPGTIFDTIAGSHPLTQEAAWEALTQVNLAADIATMPMGLHTLMVEAGKTLSIGQRQRLMIARALATQPRILFLDEATSALDNPTQHAVMESLQKLQITRVVAAHRLSTVMHADKIYVLEHGKIMQSGTYAELMAEEGLFARLVARQLV